VEKICNKKHLLDKLTTSVKIEKYKKIVELAEFRLKKLNLLPFRGDLGSQQQCLLE
jgi:hypothetical protein